MSKNRHRSLRTLPQHILNDKVVSNFFLSAQINAKKREDCFGENIANPDSIFTNSSCDENLEKIILGTDHDFSSSSSLSWSDFEYDSGTTKKVEDQLHKMDRVLKGIEPVPANFDKQEYKEWMQNFPEISIFDNSPTETLPIKEKMNNLIENKLKMKFNCDNKQIFNENESVINTENSSKSGRKKYQNLVPKRSHLENKFKNKPNSTSHNTTVNDLDIDEFLRISQCGSKLQERKQSSKSLLNTERVNRSEDSKDFLSLPFLKEEKPSRKLNSGNSHYLKQEPRKIIERNFLPPIMTNQFRSISATPRNINKSISARTATHRNKNNLSNYLIKYTSKPHILL